MIALKELIRLQRERIITIKACDKGGGIIILDFNEYLRACYMHLSSKQTQPDGTQQNRYELVSVLDIEKAKEEITKLMDEGLNNNIINQQEYNAINPQDKDLARFYCNFKVHKYYEHKKAPKPRAIISGSGSITENASLFVQHHIQEVSYSHPSYLQDTPDFLRQIDNINLGPVLPPNTMLVSMDAIALYDNIPNKEGIEALGEALDERKTPKVPTGFIQRVMEVILEWNLFEFHEASYLQKAGVAMGIHPAPNYADVFMARRVDNKIVEIVEKMKRAESEKKPILLLMLKRFLDDLFLILQGSTKQLHMLLEQMNKIHASIQFTMEHTSISSEAEEDKCDCVPTYSISFLDTSCRLENGKIEIDLFRKESARNQYLLTSSIHPSTVTRNIPFSLSLRIVRTCTNTQDREKRLMELKSMLLARSYPERLVDSAIDRARKIPRHIALKKSKKKSSKKRPIFAIKYDPRLPNIASIGAKHWRSMVSQNNYLAECFTAPPLIAFKRQRNMRESLIRAKVPPPPELRPKRKIRGVVKCGKECSACPYLIEGRNIKIDKRSTWKMNRKMSCSTFNSVYLIECQKDNCMQRYIGESKRPIRNRIADHRGYIVNKNLDKATGAHFNLPGHSLHHMKFTILEQVKQNDESYRREREKYLINKFNTFHKGLNRQK